MPFGGIKQGMEFRAFRYLLNRVASQEPTQYFTDRGGGTKDFFGSDILAKRDYLFWVYERHRDFLGHKKYTGVAFPTQLTRGVVCWSSRS